MASFLSPFNKLMFESVRRCSDTPSEVSSVDSDWSDIRSIALQLGVDNPDDLLTERFKIDRQKLENMIRSESDIPNEGINRAEQFFESTMKLTSTFISWPCRLKIGAKTKKDPHVRIVGKPEDVCKAKERVLEFLDSKGIRVIMKIDISYTDHSYIIGRGGSNIKRIMEQTQTHIHFPDSNRSNPVEKSNQVSLCGSLEGVELARSLVRSSTPLIISFELPVMAPGRPVPDNDTPYVREVEAKFNVQVIFSTRPKLHSSLVLVKGSEKEADKVQEATQLLINYMCESIANQILVNLQLEISPHHQDIVKGKNNLQLLDIMERTKTKIIFPDTRDVNIKPLKKSQVTITGTIEGVYKARQQLIGNLPVALIFDFPDAPYDTANIQTLGNKYGVFITVRQKSRQSIMCIVLKGVEKFVDQIYEARHELLQLQTPLLKPDIPAAYFAPNDHNAEPSNRKILAQLLANYPESPMTPSMQHMHGGNNANNMNMFNTNAASPFLAHQLQQQYHQQQQQQLMMGAGNGNAFAMNGNNGQLGGRLQSPNYRMHPLYQHHQQQQQQQQFYHHQSKQHLQLPGNHLQQQQQQQQFLQMQSIKATATLHHQHQQQQTNSTFLSQYQRLQQQQQQTSMLNMFNNNNPNLTGSSNTSGYHSYSSSSTSLEQLYPPYQPSPLGGGHLTTTTPVGNVGDVGIFGGGNAINNSNMNVGSTATSLNFGQTQTPLGNVGTLGDFSTDIGGNLLDGGANSASASLAAKEMELRTPTGFGTLSSFYTAEQRRKIEGFKAMEREPQGEIRTPNAGWAGLGLSKTSPFLTDATASAYAAASLTTPPRPSSSSSAAAASSADTKLSGNGGKDNANDNHNSHSNHSNWLPKSVSSPYGMNATTGLMDIVPNSQRSLLSHHKDIHSLMIHLGLEHYISTFVVNEIDIDMFASLTSDNLTELGINAFGPRKKLLMAITTLNAHRVDSLPHAAAKFSGSAAPGAERRSSNDGLSVEW